MRAKDLAMLDEYREKEKMKKVELTKEELEILHLALLSRITVFRNNFPSLRAVNSINDEIDLTVSLNSKICEAMK